MTPTILLVDDQELMIRVLQATLRPLGAQIAVAKTGKDAIQIVRDVVLPKVILLDFEMPDQNGIETLKGIRDLDHGKSIPVIMLTARDQTQIRANAESLHVHAFITKPFSPAALVKTVNDLLDQANG